MSLLKAELLMILDLLKLESCKKNGNNTVARCPACMEMGQDQTGNHLIIYEDGRFGCLIYPKEEGHEHRRRIFQLVGKKEPIKMKINIKAASQTSQGSNSIKIKNVLGRLGRHFSSHTHKTLPAKDTKIEFLIRKYKDIIESRKRLSQCNKQSWSYESQKAGLNKLEDSFSADWSKLDKSMQMSLFETLCDIGLLPDIMKKTVEIFKAKVITLI